MKVLYRSVRVLASLPVGIFLLATLFVLSFWGILFDAQMGVDLGTERFFNSWIFFAAGIFPLPALKTWAVLFGVNITCSLLFRMPHTSKKWGVLLSHIALLVLIAGSFAASCTRESFTALGFAGSRIVLNEERADGFQILAVDSDGCSIISLSHGDTLRVAYNQPQNIGAYRLYFEESLWLSAEKGIARLHVKRDPFGFVPYLFSVLLIVGLLGTLLPLWRNRRL